MKSISLLLALAAPLSMYAAQSAPPTKSPAKAPVAKAGTAAVHKPGVAATGFAGPKLPPGVPPVKGLVKTGFALKYQEVKIGTGALAEPNKLYKVHYTGWLAADGKKFDSSFDHKQPALDKDGKPEMGPDGKPKLAEGQPIQFPQGRGRVIPGWDQGFEGMKIGGKRRLFIPYQLAYGAIGRPPVIPAKSDLIFDVELVEITDFPTAPPMQGMPGGHPMPGSMTPPRPAAPAGTPPPAGTPAPGATPPPAAPAATPAPAAPATPPPAPPADKPTNPAQPN